MRTAHLALSLSLGIPAFAGAQIARPAAAVSEVKSWTVPWAGTRPRDPFVDREGRVWFVGQAGNYVARFDPNRGEFKRYAIDEGTHPHNLVVDAAGMVWFTGNTNGRIVRLDPATGTLSTFPMPDSTVRDPHTMTFDHAGTAWFTAQGAGVVGHLTPADGRIKLWRLDPRSRPYGIWLDSHGRPWFDLFGTNAIGTIDPRTGALRTYPLPNERARPRRIVVASDDAVWYGDYTRGYLGRLDPRTGAVQEYALPAGAASLPYAMTLDDRGRIWVAETGMQPNRLVAFDPSTRSFVESVPIPANGPNTIRHMTFDRTSRQIWFGGDADMLGRVQVAPASVVP